MAQITGKTNVPDEHAVVAEADAAGGVQAVSHAPFHPGVLGVNDNQTNEAGVGVLGRSRAAGVVGESETWHGVVGQSRSTTGGFGVLGESRGTGVAGVSETWIGVYGETKGDAAAVLGEGKDRGDGVKGHASGQGKAAVAGFHLTNRGPGIFGKGSPAGQFEGNVVITGGTLTVNGVAVDPGALASQLQQLSSLVQRVGQLEQKVAQLTQKLDAAQSQLNSVSSNLTARVSQTEFGIAALQSLSHSH